MAYINAKDVQAIRKELKENFKDFKFSVTKSHSSSVNVTILSGPVDFSDISDENGYAQINQYWLDRTGDHKAMFEKMIDIIKTAPMRGEGANQDGWFDKSDSMSDYFHTAYYFNVNVGKWNQPYQLAA